MASFSLLWAVFVALNALLLPLLRRTLIFSWDYSLRCLEVRNPGSDLPREPQLFSLLLSSRSRELLHLFRICLLKQRRLEVFRVHRPMFTASSRLHTVLGLCRLICCPRLYFSAHVDMELEATNSCRPPVYFSQRTMA